MVNTEKIRKNKKQVSYSLIFGVFFISIFFAGNVLLCNPVGSYAGLTYPASPVIFPSADTNNNITGFTVIDAGFRLENATTTCTFNAVFPVANDINLAGGTLYLSKDLTLSNSLSFLAPGKIVGANFYMQPFIEFPRSLETQFVPYLNALSSPIKILKDTAGVTASFGGAVNSADWSYDGIYAAGVAVTAAANEIQAYSWNGSVLTALTGGTATSAANVNRVRWHPSLYQFATTRSSSGAVEILIYQVVAGTMSALGTGAELGGNGYGLAWHQSGNFLVSGSDTVASELQLWSYNSGTGALSIAQTIDIAPDRAARAMDFSPGGNYLAVGTGTSGTNPTLLIYSFDGATLTLDSSIYTGAQVNTLSWSPTGTYIAVGMNSGTDRLRVYAHNAAASTVTEVMSARVGEANAVSGVHWDRTGKYLAYAQSAGSYYGIFYFDKSSQCLLNMCTRYSTSPINDIRWASNGLYTLRAQGSTANNIAVTSVDDLLPTDLWFDGVTLKFNADVVVSGKWVFKNSCAISGGLRKMTFGPGSSIELRDGASLRFDEVHLTNVGNSNLRCLTDNASIMLCDSDVQLSRDFTFSRASFTFLQDVLISGTSKFNYTSGQVSTISSGATLYLDNGVTFSYSPRVANKNLLVMSDVTSGLYLNGATLHSTVTGLRLSAGSFYFDNKVTISSEARNTGEAIEFGADLNIQGLGGASLDIFGIAKYA